MRPSAEEGHKTGGGDDAVRVLAQFRDLGPVDVLVKPDADPAAAADVGRPEEPGGLGRGQLLLRARRRRAPQVRELAGVMAVRPQRHE